MARKKTLNTYENQAVLSVVLAILGLLATLAAIGLLAWKFKLDTKWVVYNTKGLFLPVLGAALLAALAAGGAGWLVGLNSAGQRRNQRSRLAWFGFFLSSGVITLALCAGLFFHFTKYGVTPTP